MLIHVTKTPSASEDGFDYRVRYSNWDFTFAPFSRRKNMEIQSWIFLARKVFFDWACGHRSRVRAPIWVAFARSFQQPVFDELADRMLEIEQTGPPENEEFIDFARKVEELYTIFTLLGKKEFAFGDSYEWRVCEETVCATTREMLRLEGIESPN